MRPTEEAKNENIDKLTKMNFCYKKKRFRTYNELHVP